MRQVLVIRTTYKQTWTKSDSNRKNFKHFNFNCNILLLRNTPVKSKRSIKVWYIYGLMEEQLLYLQGMILKILKLYFGFNYLLNMHMLLDVQGQEHLHSLDLAGLWKELVPVST